MQTNPGKNLFDELNRLVEASEGGSLDLALDGDGLPDDEREAARLFNKVLMNCRAAKEYDLMKHKLAGSALGIAHWERMRDKLRAAEEWMRIILESSPFSFTMWDRNGAVIDCSQNAVKMFGYSSKRDLIDHPGRCLPEFQPNGRRSLDMLAEEMAGAFETGSGSLEWTQLAEGGEPVVFALSLVRMEYKGDHALMIYARDIREDKRMLEEIARRDEMLAAQAHWYKSLLDAIPLPVNATDMDLNLTFVNAASENLFARKREDLLGLPCSAWNVSLCGTDDCCVIRAKRGQKQTYFRHGGSSCMVDCEMIRDLSGNPAGYIKILHDVTAIESAARHQADAANEAKSAFLAVMSHEMRTPLNAVVGLSEMTLDEGGLDEEAETNLEKIYAAGSTLLSIVNDILDLSKVESGKFEIIPGEYDVPSMINDAIAQNLLRMEDKPIRFVLDIGEDMPARLFGDEIRVKQIINNLLSNAFKYTEKGTVELALTCEREGGTVWMTIRVSDTGVGIRPESRTRLFSDYTQLDAKANRKADGTGLGLSITKKLVEMMGGNISAESEYGKGSVFTAAIRQQSVNGAAIGAELAEILKSHQYAIRKRKRDSRRSPMRIPYARVLVVDDHATNLDVAKGLMKPYGMQIDCATGGQEAVDLIRGEKVRYDAVFMDHMMPGMDGMEATRLIREIGTGYADTVPIIALTANAIAGAEEMFLRNGFNAFISKPIDVARLDEALLRFVRDEDKERTIPGQTRTGRASGRNGESGPGLLGKRIEGLDFSGILKNFGDEAAFMEVLRSYAANMKPLLESIKSADRESLADYAITVHGIKGSSRSIGAESLGSMAELLERAAKSGDWDYVRDAAPSFVESAEKLVAGIEAMLADIAKNSVKPKKDKPDGELLTKLRACCDAYDMDGVDAVVAEIAAFEYESDPGFADWLRENVSRLNFAEIKEKIKHATE